MEKDEMEGNFMNRKMKRLVAAVLLCTMVCLSGSSVSAAEHKCAFSYRGTIVKSQMLVSTHLYEHYDSSTQGPEKRICQVYQTVYVDIYRCACGAQQERDMNVVVTHSGCGH